MNVTRAYYRYHELAPEARRRAYETWGEHWVRHADVRLGPIVEEDLDSLRPRSRLSAASWPTGR